MILQHKYVKKHEFISCYELTDDIAPCFENATELRSNYFSFVKSSNKTIGSMHSIPKFTVSAICFCIFALSMLAAKAVP
jgi:hypothetical protein